MITKDAVRSRTRPRYEVVEVEGWGRIGIRSLSRSRQSVRESAMRDPATGELVAEEIAKADAYQIIDQLMISEGEQMFDESDVAWLAEADSASLAPLLMAIGDFNSAGALGKTRSG